MLRVGIIPFDLKEDAVELLFVTSQTRGRWILPKGRREGDETHAETCHREGFEEAGVRGIVLEDFPFTVKIGKSTSSGVRDVPVIFYPYLVLHLEDYWPEREHRDRRWVPIEDAQKIACPDDYMVLVRHFEILREWITQAARAYQEHPEDPASQAR